MSRTQACRPSIHKPLMSEHLPTFHGKGRATSRNNASLHSHGARIDKLQTRFDKPRAVGTGLNRRWILKDNDNAGEMSPGSITESIELRENPRKKPQPGNLPRPGFEPGPPGFAARRADHYSTGVDQVITTDRNPYTIPASATSPKALLSVRGETPPPRVRVKPRKNLTQATRPDREFLGSDSLTPQPQRWTQRNGQMFSKIATSQPNDFVKNICPQRHNDIDVLTAKFVSAFEKKNIPKNDVSSLLGGISLTMSVVCLYNGGHVEL
ncbi:hypothetical protein ANN_18875 [Periplaneta americana]|uniref:Uncharacterized protein n=1 Tax=Periplaneta americana TaxID=6978 RepID=A0ABQ8SPZ0_PERAM|nr:hypothetical protein ANN_18875 [Periplaneta americana]